MENPSTDHIAMESDYVHRPAVSPEASAGPAPALPESTEERDLRGELRRKLEQGMREQPSAFLLGGFLLGLVIGVLARR